MSAAPFSSRFSSIPSAGNLHDSQSFTSFSNGGASHRPQFFKNCSSIEHFHRVHSFRSRLLQCGFPKGQSFWQKTCPVWAPFPRHSSASSLLLHGLSKGAASIRHMPFLQCEVLQGYSSAPLGPPWKDGAGTDSDPYFTGQSLVSPQRCCLCSPFLCSQNLAP